MSGNETVERRLVSHPVKRFFWNSKEKYRKPAGSIWTIFRCSTGSEQTDILGDMLSRRSEISRWSIQINIDRAYWLFQQGVISIHVPTVSLIHAVLQGLNPGIMLPKVSSLYA